MQHNVNPWDPPKSISYSEDREISSETKPVAQPSLGGIRIATAILLGIPGALLSPFAAWLAVASFGQLVFGTTLLAIPVLLTCIIAVVGLTCVWWFVLFGLQSGIAGKIQIAGIVLGTASLALVIAIQLCIFRYSEP